MSVEHIPLAQLKGAYEEICEEYRRRLNAQWDLNIKDSWWIPSDRIGITLALCDLEYSLSMEDVRLMVDLNVNYEDFNEWWNHCLGDTVEWANPMFGNYDKVYMSKIFTFTPDCMDVYDCPVERGGTGYDLHKDLPDYVDRLQPDYSLFPFVDDKTAYGFLTRGCPNKCSFCVVPKKEGNIRPYMDIDEIAQDGRRPKVHLMDNNSLACDYGIEQLVKIVDKGYRVDYNQAIDSRLITPDVAELLAQVHWLEPIKFGCDSPKQIETCERAMALIDGYCEKIGRKPRNYLLFTIIMGDINECYERISHFKQYPRVRVHAQPMREFNNPRQIIPQWQKDMARWADRKELYKGCDFKDFSPRKGIFCRNYFAD